MLGWQFVLKESLEGLEDVNIFNWQQCPKKFYSIFKQAIDSKSDTLILATKKVTDEEVLWIIYFLNLNPQIITLDIKHNQIGMKGAWYLASNKTLKSIDLSFNNIRIGAKFFASNEALITLNIAGNHIDDVTAIALAANKTLMCLDISLNQIGDYGAEALVANRSFRILRLSNNEIYHLSSIFSRNTTLRTLEIGFNKIGIEGAQILAQNKTLLDLNVNGNQIGDRGAIDLSKSNIKTLSVNSNQIGDAGAKALANNNSITILDISLNEISDIGAEDLSKNTKFISLNLNHNKIGDIGAKAFIGNTTLERLEIVGNKISALAAQAILQYHQDRNNQTLIWRNQKLAFSMGYRQFRPCLLLLHFAKNCDSSQLSKKIFEFIKPKQLTILHSFPLAITCNMQTTMNSFVEHDNLTSDSKPKRVNNNSKQKC